jgi:hypothetical protein
MAFDWKNVEGYREDMSADEKLALLENYEPATPEPEPEPAPEPAPAPAPEKPAPHTSPTPKPGYISKRDYDRVSSELAAAKRQLRSRMSEEEQREAERQDEIAARDEELKSLRRDRTLSMHKASFLGLGLGEDLAAEAAEKLADGDSEGLFDALKRHQTGYEKSLRAKILAETPKPPASDPNSEEAKRQDKDNLRRLFGLPPTK